jgi:hypothetical protein
MEREAAGKGKRYASLLAITSIIGIPPHKLGEYCSRRRNLIVRFFTLPFADGKE